MTQMCVGAHQHLSACYSDNTLFIFSTQLNRVRLSIHLSIYHLFIHGFIICNYPSRSWQKLEPIPADFVHESGYILDRSPIRYKATEVSRFNINITLDTNIVLEAKIALEANIKLDVNIKLDANIIPHPMHFLS